jgi:hypothetical protein
MRRRVHEGFGTESFVITLRSGVQRSRSSYRALDVERILSLGTYKVSIYRMFGLRNELVRHLLAALFFVWFVECNELIYHHFIPH